MVKVLLFAGGQSSRMFPFSVYTEKALLPLPNGKPIIRNLFERLTDIDSPFLPNDMTVICQPKHQAAFQHEFRDEQVEVLPMPPLGTLKTLRDAMRHYNGEQVFLVHYADMITDIAYGRLIPFHAAHEQGATAVLTRIMSPYGSVTYSLDNHSLRVDSFKEKEMLLENIWTGVAVFNRKQVLPVIEKLCAQYFDDSIVADIGRHLMPELTRQHMLYAYLHKGMWDDVGSATQYMKLMEHGSTRQ